MRETKVVLRDGKKYTFTKPCNARENCTHRKHGWTPSKARHEMRRQQQLMWPIPW